MKNLNRLFVALLACGMCVGTISVFAAGPEMPRKEKKAERNQLEKERRIAEVDSLIRHKEFRFIYTHYENGVVVKETDDVVFMPGQVYYNYGNRINSPCPVVKYETEKTEEGWRVVAYTQTIHENFRLRFTLELPADGYNGILKIKSIRHPELDYGKEDDNRGRMGYKLGCIEAL